MIPNDTNPNSGPGRAAKSYSPFWALLLVFAALIYLQFAYVMDDFKQRSQIRAASAQLNTARTQAQTIRQTTEAVGRDLLAMSTNSAEAAKIISEFKIQISNPSKPPQ